MESNHRVEVGSSTYRWIMDFAKFNLEKDKDILTSPTKDHEETQLIRGRIQLAKQLISKLDEFLPK